MSIDQLVNLPARNQAAATFVTNANAIWPQLNTYATQANALAAAMTAIAAGTALNIPYTFSTTTTDSDPGAGILRLGSATQNTATVIRADLLSSDTTDRTTILDTFDDSSNTIKGQLTLVKVSDPTKWLAFNVTAVASPSGYRNITVANIGSSAASPFSNADSIILLFTRAGDAGAAGAAGSSANYATQAQMEAATDNTVNATALSTNWHPGVAKAWIRCNNAGTIAASHNITSITDSATGLVLVTIGTDFSSANYAIVATCEDTKFACIKSGGGAPAAGTFQLGTYDTAGSPADVSYMFAACFGDQ